MCAINRKIYFVAINIFLVTILCYNTVTTELLSTSNSDTNSKSTLQLVHVIFRHGDKTTDNKFTYPNDPYINETYYPYGPGELTNKGKQREYNLGKLLRQRYDYFLNQIYSPEIIEAWSSNTNRTKVSLQLVLTGLFPPQPDQILETGLNWQPIPFHTLTDKDTLFFGIFCPNYKRELLNVLNQQTIQREWQQCQDIIDYIELHSGLNITSYMDLLFLHLTLTAEEEYGFTLPEWTQSIYPEPLKSFALKSYTIGTVTSELKKLASGTLLKRIIDTSIEKILFKTPYKDRQIFLYSGHEFNVAFLLSSLGIFEPHLPPYGSHIILELHKIDDFYGFKIYYHDYSSMEPKLLILPSCTAICPLENFVSLVEKNLPTENQCK